MSTIRIKNEPFTYFYQTYVHIVGVLVTTYVKDLDEQKKTTLKSILSKIWLFENMEIAAKTDGGTKA